MDNSGNLMVPCLFSSSSYCDERCQAESGAAALFSVPPSPQPTEQWFMEENRRGLMDMPLMPSEGLGGDTCVVNGDAMIWASESARRYCSMLDEKIPKPSIDDCSQTGATATSYLTYLQSTGEFDDEYKFYEKEQWGERSVFRPFVDIPECQDETELPQKNGVVARKLHERTLSMNISAACQLFVDESSCIAHEACEWRGDFNGRCRLDVIYMAPSFPPTIAPTAYGTSSVHVKLKLTTTSDFTENDQETVLAEVKTQFAGKEIKNFDTIIFTERRRTLLDLNATVTWRVSFDIVVAPDGNSEVFWGKELVANVLSTIQNSSFERSIKEVVPSVIEVSLFGVELASFDCDMTTNGLEIDPSQHLSIAHPVIAMESPRRDALKC